MCKDGAFGHRSNQSYKCTLNSYMYTAIHFQRVEFHYITRYPATLFKILYTDQPKNSSFSLQCL